MYELVKKHTYTGFPVTCQIRGILVVVFFLGGSKFYGFSIQTTLIGAVARYSTFMTPETTCISYIYFFVLVKP